MTPERFRKLTEAYGAAPEHWPEAERDGAEALLARRDPDAIAALAAARGLDLELSAHAIAAPDADLIRRILAAAPSPSPLSSSLPSSSRARQPAWKRPRWWLSGAGFVGAGAAGVAAGVLAISLAAPFSYATNPPNVFDQSDASTTFGSAAPDWSNQ
jgi:hypothetical protein